MRDKSQLSGILLGAATLKYPHCTSYDKYMTSLLLNGAGRFGCNGLYQLYQEGDSGASILKSFYEGFPIRSWSFKTQLGPVLNFFPMFCFTMAIWMVDITMILVEDDEERTRRTQKEKGDTHLYTIIKVARDEDLAGQIGRDIYDDLIDDGKVFVAKSICLLTCSSADARSPSEIHWSYNWTACFPSRAFSARNTMLPVIRET